jgi:hypothetical protein
VATSRVERDEPVVAIRVVSASEPLALSSIGPRREARVDLDQSVA